MHQQQYSLLMLPNLDLSTTNHGFTVENYKSLIGDFPVLHYYVVTNE